MCIMLIRECNSNNCIDCSVYYPLSRRDKRVHTERRARHKCTYLEWIRVDNSAALSVLLLKFRLVRLEHADLAPSIEKQSDGSHPQDQDKNDDQDLLGSHHYRARSCNP